MVGVRQIVPDGGRMETTSEVFNEDCMIGMARYPDKWFDLAVVDPPYGIGVSKMAYLTENKTTVKQKNGTRLKPRKTIYKVSEWDNMPPQKEYFDELIRVSHNQIIWGINYMPFKGDSNGIIKWDKCIPDGLSFKKYEFAYCSMIDYEIEFKYLYSGFNIGMGLNNPTTAEKDYRKIPKRIHPTQKPIALYSWIFDRYATKGMKILDTHLGSQSSRIAADKAGMNFTGFELDKDYFDAGCKRYDQYKQQLTLQF